MSESKELWAAWGDLEDSDKVLVTGMDLDAIVGPEDKVREHAANWTAIEPEAVFYVGRITVVQKVTSGAVWEDV